jgi:hypothetical protein
MASVPEVVPDEHAFADEQRPVQVGGCVAGRRGQSDEQEGADAGEAAREQDLAPRRDQPGDGGCHGPLV